MRVLSGSGYDASLLPFALLSPPSSAAVVRIKAAIKSLRGELNGMEVRAGVLSHALLQRSITHMARQGHRISLDG